MFFNKNLVSRLSVWRKYSLCDNLLWSFDGRYRSYSSLRKLCKYTIVNNECRYNQQFKSLTHKRLLSNIFNKDESNNGNIQGDEIDIKNITKLFPEPRVTLNILQTRTPDKIFDVYYKQNVVTLKGKKKKTIQNDWNCTYAFVWPEKMKFESTAISKRLAAEKAATQALYWLYTNQRIDNNGIPIYDTTVLNDIRTNLNPPIDITMSDNSVERIARIWNDYEDGIKQIYEATFEDAKRKLLQSPAVITKDSTIDQDDYSDKHIDVEENANDNFEQKVNVHPVYGIVLSEPSEKTLERREKTLTKKFELYDNEKTTLPIDEFAEQISSTVSNNRVTIIVGEAGCGKSTRVPVALLKHSLLSTAVVSEPRRVAAIGLAQRVASELNEEVGETIGYQVRLHSKPPRPPAGSILYCTSGVLLRRLQTNPGLNGCTHVFIDEAHERDVNTDITLLLLKRALRVNPELKVIVMSATLNVDVFTRYFDSCPVIKVPGRTFPVQVMYIDELQKKYNLKLTNCMENISKEDGRSIVNCQEVAEVIKSIDKQEKEGAILVFLPGWAEIKNTMEILQDYYKGSSLHMIIPVHSRLSTADQTRMFSSPPLGVRKIVLSTNVAETSITIPDVVHVIDSGTHKENNTRQKTGTLSLETVLVSRAGAKQRSGRAGRVQPGNCYKLYTKEKEDEFAPHTTPEILRVPLVQTVLDCKSYAPEDKVEDFLSQLPEPPSSEAIRFAVKDLIEIGAMTPREQLTRLGGVLYRMSLPPRVALCVLHSLTLGDVIAAATVATHATDNHQLFYNGAQRREEIREIKKKFNSTCDYCALYWIQDEFEQMLAEHGWRGLDSWCEKYGLNKDRLKYVKDLTNLYLEQAFSLGIIEPTIKIDELNRFSGIDELTSAVLLSGSDTLLYTKRKIRTKGKLMTDTVLYNSAGDRAHISSESVNHNLTKRNHKTNMAAYFGGHHSAERRALVVYKTSLVSPHTVVLFAMADVKMESYDEDNAVLYIPKHKLRIHMPSNQADSMLKAREMLWNTFKYYIERDINNLDYDDNTTVSRFKIRLIKAVGRILVEGSRQYLDGKKENMMIDE